MDSLLVETFGVLGESLTLKDILSLATTNQGIRDIFRNPEINNQLAKYYGFPYGLSLTELKTYEAMNVNERMKAAAKTGDLRIIDKCIELGADDIIATSNIASYCGHGNVVDRMMELGPINFNMAALTAAKGGHLHIFNKLASILQFDGFYQEDLNDWMSIAAQNGHENIIARRFSVDARPML